jgi:hypothetical protein
VADSKVSRVPGFSRGRGFGHVRDSRKAHCHRRRFLDLAVNRPQRLYVGLFFIAERHGLRNTLRKTIGATAARGVTRSMAKVTTATSAAIASHHFGHHRGRSSLDISELNRYPRGGQSNASSVSMPQCGNVTGSGVAHRMRPYHAPHLPTILSLCQLREARLAWIRFWPGAWPPGLPCCRLR